MSEVLVAVSILLVIILGFISIPARCPRNVNCKIPFDNLTQSLYESKLDSCNQYAYVRSTGHMSFSGSCQAPEAMSASSTRQAVSSAVI